MTARSVERIEPLAGAARIAVYAQVDDSGGRELVEAGHDLADVRRVAGQDEVARNRRACAAEYADSAGHRRGT